MRVAISGADGLIGGAVYRHLMASADVLRIGRRPTAALHADFAKPESVAGLDLRGCDAIVHCAGVVDEDFAADPAAAYIQSTLGVSALLQTARAAKVSRFVYVSTCHVYGPLVGTITEDSPVNPVSDYAIAHFAAEQIIRRHTAAGGWRALILRPNAVFGRPTSLQTFDRWHLIPYAFPRDAVDTQRIVLRTAGDQRRNFISITDLAMDIGAFLAADGPAPAVHVVNPVGPATLSVYEFAQRCAAVYEARSGQSCAIDRPAPGVGDPAEAKFAFQSLHGYQGTRCSVDEYLTEFIDMLIADRKAGARYGT